MLHPKLFFFVLMTSGPIVLIYCIDIINNLGHCLCSEAKYFVFHVEPCLIENWVFSAFSGTLGSCLLTILVLLVIENITPVPF
uniref:Uncharacterized protein n=1 Tax=Ixodes scapularis TaxID=6945 RepID=A0A4D5RB04_IXOSC